MSKINGWFKNHIGHKLECVVYGESNTTIECTTCNEVIIDDDVLLEYAMNYIDTTGLDIVKKYISSTMTNENFIPEGEYDNGIKAAGKEINTLINNIENGEYLNKDISDIEFTGSI